MGTRAHMTIRQRTATQWLSTAVAATLIAAGGGGPSDPKTDGGPPKVVHTAVLTIGAESTPETYEATGTVKALFNATLSSKVMARVVSVSVRDGDSVAKGQSLVSLDGRELSAAVDM